MQRFTCAPIVCSGCIDQILCAHAATVVFSSATKFEVPRLAVKDRSCANGPGDERSYARDPGGSTAIPGAAVALQVLVLAQRRRLAVAMRRSDEKGGEPTRDGMQGQNVSRDDDVHPFDVIVKSESSERIQASLYHSRNADTAKVLPINESRVPHCTPEDRIAFFLPQQEWTVDSVGDVEQQELSAGSTRVVSNV